jgi:hypothetical protein
VYDLTSKTILYYVEIMEVLQKLLSLYSDNHHSPVITYIYVACVCVCVCVCDLSERNRTCEIGHQRVNTGDSQQ